MTFVSDGIFPFNALSCTHIFAASNPNSAADKLLLLLVSLLCKFPSVTKLKATPPNVIDIPTIKKRTVTKENPFFLKVKIPPSMKFV